MRINYLVRHFFKLQTSDFGLGVLAFASSWYLFKTFSKRQHDVCIDLSNLSSHKMNIKNPA